MKRSLFFSSLVIICGLLIYGCKGKKESETPGSIRPPAGQGPAAEAPIITLLKGKPAESMIASVNGEIITRADVDQMMDIILMQFGGQIPSHQINQVLPGIFRQALATLINQSLLLQEAERQEVEPEPKAIDEEIAKIKAGLPDPDKFEEQLTASGITKEQFRQRLIENLKIEILVKKSSDSEADITEEETEAFYNDNLDNFRTPERVQASHILIKVDLLADEAQKDKARAKIEEIERRLKDGEDFEALARELSDCPSSTRGGDLGYFTRGQMEESFEEVAFSTSTGEISEILETKFGYHLIRVVDHPAARVAPLEEVSDEIKILLNRRKQSELVVDYLERLRSNVTIKYAEGFQPPVPRSSPGSSG